MKNNVRRKDLDAVIKYLRQADPMLTQSGQVRAFEREWSEWLGVRYSVFVNSGSSANLITMTALREHYGLGEIIVPPLTWVSDIASVLQCGFKPVFADINPRTLGLDCDEVLRKIGPSTKAVFLTHILGYCALNQRLIDALKERNMPLIEDACESHGATLGKRKLGTVGLMSNFSFYYAHHMSTIEGGMVCTNDRELYETTRMLRSHGMVRESTSAKRKKEYLARCPDLNPDFIFAFPAYNVRNTEINAVLGRSQLKSLDKNNQRRQANLRLFLSHLDPAKYRTDFEVTGSCNYAFTLILNEPDTKFMERVMRTLSASGVEFRRGTSGGGNQLRQPYLKRLFPPNEAEKFPHADHVHFFGLYLGNYPELDRQKISDLCDLLNGL
ncbi:MAG: DegT/DnrJ/EryC1/StrS aminotransferase family protein [Deltaproteobacteria bacterium]|nr:DegT/DnrJ/EryC1/StrS aminotransferase family protein [Deltaproteobacteria bacterium]